MITTDSPCSIPVSATREFSMRDVTQPVSKTVSAKASENLHAGTVILKLLIAASPQGDGLRFFGLGAFLVGDRGQLRRGIGQRGKQGLIVKFHDH